MEKKKKVRQTFGEIWLSWVQAHPLLTHLLPTIILAILAESIISQFQLEMAMAGQIALHVMVALIAIAIPIAVSTFALWPYTRAILGTLSVGKGRSWKAMSQFVQDELKSMQNQIKDIRAQGTKLDRFDVAQWVRRCFETSDGRYLGTAVNEPSVYLVLFGDYLTAHEKYIERTDITNSERVILLREAQIRQDRMKSDSDFRFFFGWHRSNSV